MYAITMLADLRARRRMKVKEDVSENARRGWMMQRRRLLEEEGGAGR
jgi:hypothetical protein